MSPQVTLGQYGMLPCSANPVKLLSTLQSNKNPKTVPKREPPGGFCDIGCCFTSLEVFHPLLFILLRVLRFSVSNFYPQTFLLCPPIRDTSSRIVLYHYSQNCPFRLAHGFELLIF